MLARVFSPVQDIAYSTLLKDHAVRLPFSIHFDLTPWTTRDCREESQRQLTTRGLLPLLMMPVLDVPVHHQVQLIISMHIDLNGSMISIRNLLEHLLTHGYDLVVSRSPGVVQAVYPVVAEEGSEFLVGFFVYASVLEDA